MEKEIKRAAAFAGGDKLTQIYVLIDPRTDNIRYVGKTNDIKRRLVKHICESKLSTKSHKKAWINQLLKLNLKPIIEVVDVVSIYEWEFWEQHYISLYKSWGFNLTNLTKGGGGVLLNVPVWNKGLKGIMKPNQTTFKPGNNIGKETRFKTGNTIGKETRFYKGMIQNKNIPHYTVPVLKYDIDGNFIQEFNSYRDAANDVNVVPGSIRAAVNKKYKCKGFIWKKK